MLADDTKITKKLDFMPLKIKSYTELEKGPYDVGSVDHHKQAVVVVLLFNVIKEHAVVEIYAFKVTKSCCFCIRLYC